MMLHFASLLTGLMLAVPVATPAFAQITGALPAVTTMAPTPVLKRDVTVASDLVRIGDVIENAGPGARVPIFRSPDLGQTGTVSAMRVMEALRAHGFTIVETRGIQEVAVTRASRHYSVKDLETRIAEALAGQSGLGDARNLSVTLDRDARPIQLEPNTPDLQPSRIFYDIRSGRFDVTFEVPGSAIARRTSLRYVGTVVETVEAAVLTRPLGR